MILGIDIGTTGCKAVVYNYDFKQIASSYKEYNFSKSLDGSLELNPKLVWQSLQTIIRDVNDNCEYQIKALSISAIGDIVIPLGDNGTIIRNSIVDFDLRGREEIAQFTDSFGKEKLFEITGMPPLFINSLSKILWLKKNEPENYEKVKRWATYEDYLLECMGLPPVTNLSLAARMMLLNVKKYEWSKEVLDAAEIRIDQLPELSKPGEIVGRMPVENASALGFKEPPLVITGCHDMVCAAIGSGLTNSNGTAAVNIVGTIEGLVVSLQKPRLNKTMLENNYSCYPGYDGYITFGVNLTSGCVLKWVRDTMAKELIIQSTQNGRDVYDLLMSDLNIDCPANEFFIPYFAGSGNPDFSIDETGAICGLTLNSTRDSIVQALIEGLCFEVYEQLETMGMAGIEINELITVGGGAKSSKWNELKSIITGLPVIVPEIDEISAFGAALIAATGIGLISEPFEYFKTNKVVSQSFNAHVLKRDKYIKKYKEYRELKAELKTKGKKLGNYK